MLPLPPPHGTTSWSFSTASSGQAAQESLHASLLLLRESVLFIGSRFSNLYIAVECVCVCLLLQDLVQSCLHGGEGIWEDMCYERRRAEACVD